MATRHRDLGPAELVGGAAAGVAGALSMLLTRPAFESFCTVGGAPPCAH